VSELDDVRAEIAALREEVAQLRGEAADTRALAAMADRDAAGVRGAINAINKTQTALRETQVEHSRTLDHIAQAVGALVTSVHRHDQVLDQLVTGQAQLAATQDEILRRLTPEDT
jgi:chromosome segregation ATPase